jgi:hypothetical protein
MPKPSDHYLRTPHKARGEGCPVTEPTKREAFVEKAALKFNQTLIANYVVSFNESILRDQMKLLAHAAILAADALADELGYLK